MMTKKNYIAIASMMNQVDKSELSTGQKTLFVDICNRLADIFENDNPRFDYSKFVRACGILDPEFDSELWSWRGRWE
jgi:hypothetical protein